MALRDLIRRLERSASGEMESFKLRDGTTYFYDRAATYRELYLFCYDMELATESDVLPQPPEILERITEAQDPSEVVERFKPRDPVGGFVNRGELYDVDVLVRERRLVLREE
jgi:hypothetical protein